MRREGGKFSLRHNAYIYTNKTIKHRPIYSDVYFLAEPDSEEDWDDQSKDDELEVQQQSKDINITSRRSDSAMAGKRNKKTNRSRNGSSDSEAIRSSSSSTTDPRRRICNVQDFRATLSSSNIATEILAAIENKTTDTDRFKSHLRFFFFPDGSKTEFKDLTRDDMQALQEMTERFSEPRDTPTSLLYIGCKCTFKNLRTAQGVMMSRDSGGCSSTCIVCGKGNNKGRSKQKTIACGFGTDAHKKFSKEDLYYL